MSTVYSVRSSAVRAAKKACGPDQEWVITPVGEGFTFTVLDVEEKQPATLKTWINAVLAADAKQPAPVTTAEKVEAGIVKVNIAKARKEAAILAETGATEAEHAAHRAESPMKPFQLAKKIVADMTKAGPATRKEIIAAGLAAGIKYNTIDGAYYELCVRKS